MNNIPTEQNTERQLQRLAAQRQLYATAKTLFGWQVFLGGPVAIVFSFFVIVFPQMKAFAALWGILVSMGDLVWLTPWLRRLRNEAARVQELFDCDVLVLTWDDVKAGRRPDPELVKEQSEKYKKWGASMPPLTNWYDPYVGSLPLHIARLACQRTNCWWDAKQRRRYATWAIGIVSVIFLAVLFLAMGKDSTIEDFVIKVVAPLSPALLLGFRQFAEQMEAASRLDTLKDHAERLWDDALAGKKKSEIAMRARRLQNEILENRRRSPLVFDGVFKRLRRDYEVQMNHGIAEFVAEAKKRLGLP